MRTTSIYVRTQALNTLNARSARVQFSESHHVLREELNVYSKGEGEKKKEKSYKTRKLRQYIIK